VAYQVFFDAIETQGRALLRAALVEVIAYVRIFISALTALILGS
jgi:hypothetical protein